MSFITIILITSIKNGSQLPLEFIARLLEQLLRLSHALQISYHSSIHNSIYNHAWHEPILKFNGYGIVYEGILEQSERAHLYNHQSSCTNTN